MRYFWCLFMFFHLGNGGGRRQGGDAPPAKKRGIEVKADEKAKEADAAPPIKKRGRPTKASQEVRIIPQLVSDDREQN